MTMISTTDALLLYTSSMASQKLIKKVESMMFDGNFDPQKAMKLLAEASDRMYEQQLVLNNFVSSKKMLERKDGVVLVEDLNISQHTVNLLKRNKIFTLADLVSYIRHNSLTELKGCGKTISAEINAALECFLLKNGPHIKQRRAAS